MDYAFLAGSFVGGMVFKYFADKALAKLKQKFGSGSRPSDSAKSVEK